MVVVVVPSSPPVYDEKANPAEPEPISVTAPDLALYIEYKLVYPKPPTPIITPPGLV